MKQFFRLQRTFTAIGLVLSAYPLAAAAQVADGAVPDQGVIETAGEGLLLDEVVVLSANDQLKQAPGVSTIGADDIARLPIANDLSDIIRRQPGVNLTGNTVTGVRGNSRQIDLRGMGPENTLILIDGKPVLSRNAIRLGRSGERDTRGDSNWVPAEAVERIEVLRGPAAARYGSGASGGVVNIITKRPESLETVVSTYLNVPYHSEEGETVRFNIVSGGPLGQNGAFRVYGNYNRTDADDPDINAAAARAVLPNLAPPAGREGVENRDVRGVFTWYANDQNEFDFEAAYSRQGNIFSGDRQLATVTDILTRLAEEGEETNTLYRTTLATTHRGTYGWAVTNSYLQWENTRNSRFLEGTAGATEGAINTDERGTIRLDNWTAKSEANIPFNLRFEQNLTVGAEFRGERLEDPVSIRQTGIPGLPIPADPALRDDTVSSELYAIYVEDNIYVTDRLVLTPGVRGDYHSEFGANLSPSLNASFDATSEISFKAGIARAFKAPNLYQLNENYLYFTMGNGCPVGFGAGNLGGGCYVLGNPDLEPETSVNKEFGIAYNDDAGWGAGLTYFHNDYRDRITSGVNPILQVPNPNQQRLPARVFRWENTPEAVVSGLEGNLLVPLLAGLNWRSNATYMIESEDKRSGQPLSLIPEYTIHSALEWQATDRLDVTLSASHFGKTEAPTLSPVTGVDEADTSALDPYTIVNIGLNFQAHERLRLGAGVTNVFDERLFRLGSGTTAGAATFNEPGRSFYLRASATF